jgi:hypothetical protein
VESGRKEKGAIKCLPMKKPQKNKKEGNVYAGVTAPKSAQVNGALTILFLFCFYVFTFQRNKSDPFFKFIMNLFAIFPAR